MPLVRITLARGRAEAERRAIADAVHRALVETAAVPAADRFQVIEEVEPASLIWSPDYLGIARGPGVVFVQITLNAGRTVAVKRALYAALADHLAAAGVRREDVVVSLLEVTRENWSFGNGLMSYPPPQD